MKISLSWLLDHVIVSKQEIDIQKLAAQFNETTAEIDAVETIKTNLSSFYAVSIKESTEYERIVTSVEQGKDLVLPERKELHTDGLEGWWYLIKHDRSELRWATLMDVGSSKDGLLPPLYMSKEQAYGSWRDSVEAEDTIFTIDNKAITNRPDLWGHRGCAREVAAVLHKELLPEESLLADLPIVHFESYAPQSSDHAYQLLIEKNNGITVNPCKRIATLALSQVAYRPSIPWMAVRLARVDLRPIDALVDLTNYVMADLGQPMHAFDSKRLSTKSIVVRYAQSDEKIELIDGEEISLDPSMCIIADGDQPISLAGIMGGKSSAVSPETSTLLLESGSFDATTIRMSATRLKKRTEASTRFEKNLDPNQNTTALLRYIKLLDEIQIPYKRENGIQSLGPLMKEKVIELSHALIEQKIGMKISAERITAFLKRLEFGVAGSEQLVVTVPTFRATKDISIPEDIVEEVARFFGYKNIIPELPTRTMAAYAMNTIERKRRLKHMLAYGLSLREVQTYAFYDEEFLNQLAFKPEDALKIANPQSEHWQRLITSLVPNLIKCVVSNHQEDNLRFFEINRVWFMEKGVPIETEECAGIWYEKKQPIDFYEGKALVEKMFLALKIPVKWKKVRGQAAPWYDLHQTAELWSQDRIVGRVGKCSKRFLNRVVEGDAFIFELDAQFLKNYEPVITVTKPLSKYPSTEQDISVLVPHSLTVAQLEEAIVNADSRITTIYLIDSFEKPEWPDQKSLTFRYRAEDLDGTLSKEDIDTIWKRVTTIVTGLGGEIR